MAVTGNEFLDRVITNLPYALIPVVGPTIAGGRILSGAGSPPAKKPPATTSESPEATTSSTGARTTGNTSNVDAGTPNLPTQQGLPQGAPDLSNFGALVKEIFDRQAAEAEAARKFYPERAEIDLDVWKRTEELRRRNVLERMEEKTRRDVELKTIDAWRGVTEAGINRDAYLAQGMMQLSATLGMPNPNVMQANAGIIQQGIGAFRPGTPVF